MPGSFQVAAAAVIEKDDKILILRRSRYTDHYVGAWETPSGRLEQGESPQDALIREVKEETNLDIEVLVPLKTFHIYRGREEAELIGITFACRYVSENLYISDEHSDFHWLASDEVDSFPIVEPCREEIKLFLRAKAAGLLAS